jgi:hypothetical protein
MLFVAVILHGMPDDEQTGLGILPYFTPCGAPFAPFTTAGILQRRFLGLLFFVFYRTGVSGALLYILALSWPWEARRGAMNDFLCICIELLFASIYWIQIASC